MVLKLWFCLLFFTLGIPQTFAQYNYTHQLSYPDFNDSHANALLLRIENNNYFKNNEYFGEYIEGYTLLGNDIQPSLMYYAGNRVRIKLGVHLQKYSGIEFFSQVTPVISIHTRLTRHIDLIMGALRGSIHHQVSEPLFNSEKRYSRPVENGLQFIFNFERHWADIWLDWENFIQNGDTEPEKLVFGISSKHKWIVNSENWQINTPLVFLVNHSGGQITIEEQLTQTLINASAGFEIVKHLGAKQNSIALKSDALLFHDNAKNAGLPFNTGYGNNTGLYSQVGKFQVSIGHFHGFNFMVPLGNGLFQSLSNYLPNVYRKNINLINLKAGYGQKLLKELMIDAMAEAYYNYDINHIDYSFGLSLLFLPNWTIIKHATN
jgi:hypothetical protein